MLRSPTTVMAETGVHGAGDAIGAAAVARRLLGPRRPAALSFLGCGPVTKVLDLLELVYWVDADRFTNWVDVDGSDGSDDPHGSAEAA
ncbi:hypothetical protein V6N11_047726 [Hibiscus sabdariffa]|uniref:Uncharacterized protein n=1 Tax=Hibiscus sabdariffa TaxID=183260 RepID=A0ABR2P7S2_9ROSI